MNTPWTNSALLSVTFILVHSGLICLRHRQTRRALPSLPSFSVAQEFLHFVAVGSGKMVAQASACEEPVCSKPPMRSPLIEAQVARALSLPPARTAR